MKSDEHFSGHSLPAEAETVVWRILATWASPWNREQVDDLCERMLGDFSVSDQGRMVDELRSWFESGGGRTWLRSDVEELVSAIVVDGVGHERSTMATWAIGSINSHVMGGVVRSRWSTERIDDFVEQALTELERLCERDDVLDVTRCTRFAGSSALDPWKTKIPKDSLVRDGRLETFREMDSHLFDLVHSGLYPAIGNLIDLVLDLRPAVLKSMVERLDHPVIQARAVDRVMAKNRHGDHRISLQWIGRDSCDALLALAIVHTINTVNALDQDLRAADRTADHQSSTELLSPRDDVDKAGADLIAGLVDSISNLDPEACAGWIGEVLSGAPYMLGHDPDREIPRRVDRLEEECTRLLGELFRKSWSKGLVASLRRGLCRTPRKTWTRHMADVAWEIRDSGRERAVEIAIATLDEDRRYVVEGLQSNHLYTHWDEHTRRWARGLGEALALAQADVRLIQWASERCKALPLTAWDAEEDFKSFITADEAAQHWFLVAFHGIEPLKETGRAVDTADVRGLAELLFAHCHFARQHQSNNGDCSETVEYAARCVIEYGEPSGAWLLNQARNPGVGPRVLWALIDQQRRRNRREGQVIAHDRSLTREYRRLSAKRFRDGCHDDLESLQYWGQLWLLLKAIDEAEITANRFMAVLDSHHGHDYEIIVLKLLALVHAERPLPPDLRAHFASLYRQLWPGYTREEGGHRKEIDDLLKRSALPLL
ncbi:MAG: hypothetical protein OXJ90_25805 [Spirochaetaceae bacterium]|nr:hypothetical protein [Spirochaetaceae bacterium]